MPKFLIIGHARSGKDTAAEYISEMLDLSFISSSEFVAREIIWDEWGKDRYDSFESMFADRVNHRARWSELIHAYNTPDLARTARTMFERGYDLYVGMRDADEFQAGVEEGLFDEIIWIEAGDRVPPEDNPHMTMVPPMANWKIENNLGISEFLFALDDFCNTMRERYSL